MRGTRVRLRRGLVVSLSVLLVVSLVGGAPPAFAADPDRSTWTEQQRRDHGRKFWPRRSERPMPVTVEGSPAARRPGLASAPVRSVVWPSAGVATVAVPAAAQALRSRAPYVSAAPGGLPVGVRAGDARQVRVEVLDRATADRAGVRGVVLRVGDSVAGLVDLKVDYSGFAGAFGGDWATRLRLVRLPECVLTDPARAECRRPTPVASRNNVKAGTVTGSVDAADAAGTVMALTAGPSGSSGDWAATSLSPSSTWQVSPQTGAFSWNYPLRVPPATGPAPQLALGYSSGSVDGRVASTNNQTSWIGDGFELWPGYVERKYISCADDTTGGNNAGHPTGTCAGSRTTPP